MNQIQKRNLNAVASGSLSNIASKQGLTLAEAFMACDAIITIDTSASMDDCDVRPGDHTYSRYQAACDELTRLQNELPGKVAVISFSSEVEFCPSGIPTHFSKGTAMEKALNFIKVADGCGIRLIFISDGEAWDEASVLRIARTFASKIDTIFIGREGAPGQRFLRELAEATGGMSYRTGTQELTKLGANIRLMLEA